MSTLKIEEIAKQIFFDEEKLKDNELHKELIKEVNAYVGKALNKVSGKNNEKFLKNLQDANAMDGEWVFDCFDKIFSSDVWKCWKPDFVVSHYRGLRFTDAKETSKFTPSNPEQYEHYNTFLENYENVQGDGRHTLNSLLSDFAEAENILEQIFVCCQFAEKTELEKNDKYITLNLSNEICKILLGDGDEIINEINMLDDDEKKENVKKKLFNKRNAALHCAIADSDEEFTNLKTFLQDLTAMLLKNLDDHESEVKSIWLELLQVIQGICLWLKKFGGLLIGLVSRVSDKETTGCDCVGEFFVLGKNNTGVGTFCKNVFPLVDNIQRYYFKTVLSQIPAVDSEACKSLGFALQNTYDAEEIIALLRKRVFNFNSLAGVIRLAEVIRPFAVHEGKQQTIFFVVGYPYLMEDKLISISKFSNGNTIRWEKPGDKSQRPTENEALHTARTRIMGSSQILQNPGVALFVDCNEAAPICNHVVKPAPRGTIGFNTNIVSIMADVTNAFIVKIIGQRKIEIFHKGRKILVWSHINATWEKESTWDAKSLTTLISKKFSGHSAIKIVAEAIYQISQKLGLGGSFVICKNDLPNKDVICPKMTIPFPKLGEGEIIDSKGLLDVAIEDGGTLIDLTSNKFYGRRQWLPHRNNEPPFWYENFTILENEWIKFYNETWDCKDCKDNKKEKAFPVSDTPPELYKICKSEFFKKTINSKDFFCKNLWHWEEWYKVLSWGTRHISSMGMSACLWDQAVVVVVSADSTITVFYQGIEQKAS